MVSQLPDSTAMARRPLGPRVTGPSMPLDRAIRTVAFTACSPWVASSRTMPGTIRRGTSCSTALPFACTLDAATVVSCSGPSTNPCTSVQCGKLTGKCAYAIVPNGTICDADDDPCTVGDACKAGACAKGKALPCDDGNPCTADTCDAKAGCQHIAQAGKCDDGNPCTVGDTCKQGKCAAIDGVCRPGTDKHCQLTPGCQSDGACGYDQAKCVPTTAVHCLISEACQHSGQCTWLNSECVATE